MEGQQLSREEIRELAVRLQESFLQEHSEDTEMDGRDISHIQNDISYVEKFVRHNRGNLENAYSHMVECLNWRKSFGVCDIKYEDIDEDLWRSGMAMNHGMDARGQNIVILNIAKHKKDPKKSPMLHKWIAFCYEMHQKVYPQNRLCMVFDMSGAGLNQMDMDLVRFIINCFKIYFPDLLEWLLVFNIPWILQAAWKIVQSWLSDGAAAKVKFVTPETIQNFIPADNLLKKFGGNDPWEYVYEVEKERMLQQIREAVENREASGASRAEFNEEDDMYLEEDESSVREEVDQGGVAGPGGSLKQVRFSYGLPPTRQSRYGTDEDIPPVSLDQGMLRKGTAATSNGFRKKQVSRLMSLQESPRSSEGGGGGGGGMDESVNSLRRRAQPSSESAISIGDLILSPSHELIFSGKNSTSDVVSIVTLKNASKNIVAYKIKTTAPLRYKVRPNLALVDPKSVSKVQVVLTAGADVKTSQDKFLVQAHTFPDNMVIPKPADLITYWKSLPSASLSEHRMRCRWMTEVPSSKEAGITVTKNNMKAVEKPTTNNTGARKEPVSFKETVEQKVQKLLIANAKLSERVISLQILNYIVISLLTVLIVMVYMY